ARLARLRRACAIGRRNPGGPWARGASQLQLECHRPTPTLRGERRPRCARGRTAFVSTHRSRRPSTSVGPLGAEAGVQHAIVDKTPRGTGVALEARVGARLPTRRVYSRPRTRITDAGGDAHAAPLHPG